MGKCLKCGDETKGDYKYCYKCFQNKKVDNYKDKSTNDLLMLILAELKEIRIVLLRDD